MRGGQNARVPEEEFIQMFMQHGCMGTARMLNMDYRKVSARRRNIERRNGILIKSPDKLRCTRSALQDHPARVRLTVSDGVVLVGSDAHYWPGIVTTAHRAFLRFCKRLAPVAVVMNGDVADFGSISRHPPINWEDRPLVQAEIETASERLDEIMKASGNAKHVWCLGNHDGRFETRLATVAPEYAKVKGVHLKDHFPGWKPGWSVWINDDVVIKHRIKGGIHATHNNTMWAGKTTVTGHLHSAKVTPFTDYTGTRWGVDCGTLADPYGPQFEYLEDGPRNWRSGFVVLTFRDGRLMWPEICSVAEDGKVDFRGELVAV